MDAKSKILIINKTPDSDEAEIFLYGYIGDGDASAAFFVRELRALEKDYSRINLRINSGGGSVFEGIAIYNAILSSTAEINTYIDGLAASMASVIALAGKRVYISRNATYMTHLPSTYASGSSENIKRSASLLESLEKTMLGIYMARTGKPEADCKKLYMNGKDNWFTAEQAVAEGLVDEVYEMPPVKAPAKAHNERAAYMEYAAMLNDNPKQKKQMDTILLTAEQLAMLPGMKAGTTPTQQEVNAALASLAAKAANADALQASLTQANADLQKEKDEFAAYKEKEQEGAIAAMLKTANEAGKTTVEQNKILAVTYKGNPEGLKAWLATLQPQQRIVPEIGGSADELVKMSWRDLDKGGKLEALKAQNPEAFKAKYKAEFGKDYGA